jgi:hypothetical protein
MCYNSLHITCRKCQSTMTRKKKALVCADALTGFGSCEKGVHISPRKEPGPRLCHACRQERAAALAVRNHIAFLQRESDK